MPSRFATLLFASWIITPVGSKLPSLSDLYTNADMAFIETPKSSMAFVSVRSAIVHEIVKVLGSLHFCSMLGGIIADTILAQISAKTFSRIFTCSPPFNFLLCVHNSFRNFAYFEIYLISSRIGIMTSTFLKFYSSSLSNLIFLAWDVLVGKGTRTPCHTSVSFALAGWGVIFVALDFASVALFCYKSLPLLKVMTLTFPFGLVTFWEGICREPCDCNWFSLEASYPIYVCKSWMVAVTFCWN